MHARYACRHRGACCTSGWPIPLEASRVASVQRAIDDGRIGAPASWLSASASGGLLAIDEHTRCVFRRDERCSIHGMLGPGALPSACQHFPRVVLIDRRGTFVTLSHYCPTAAALLFDDRDPPTIVEGPPALPDGSMPEGLDARDAWPPLLTRRTLMDHESYDLWEAHMIRTLGADPPEVALARLEEDVVRIEQWRHSEGPLLDAVRAVVGRPALDSVRAGEGPPLQDSEEGTAALQRGRAIFDLVRGAVHPPLAWPDAPSQLDSVWRAMVSPGWPLFAPVIGRYLAAHAFASWVAYQGASLRAVVRLIRAALTVLEVETARVCIKVGRPLDRTSLLEGVRQSDLLLVHYADRQALADALSC